LIGDLRWIVAGIIHLPTSLEQILRTDESTDTAVVNAFARLRKYSYFGHAYLPYGAGKLFLCIIWHKIFNGLYSLLSKN
jgi:hypothetical protein